MKILFEPAYDKTFNKTCVTCEGSDKPEHLCSLCLPQSPGYSGRDEPSNLAILDVCTGWFKSLLVAQVLVVGFAIRWLLLLSCGNIYRIRPNYRTYSYKRTVKRFRSLKITGSVLFCLLLYKGICCGYSFELHRLVDAIQMSTHNICVYKENQKNCIINIK